MQQIDVCMSPDLLHLYDIKERIVVVTDILRATSCMTTGIAHGVDHIVPVSTLEECQALKAEGYITAAERNGARVAGFDIGNSPFSYMEAARDGQKVAVTTSNGTIAINKSREAVQVLIGSFLNLSAVVNYVAKAERDLLVLCAGWKGKVNLEDTLFAGAMVGALSETHQPECDAPLMAARLYAEAKSDLNSYMAGSSHVNRLKRLGIARDISFCLTLNEYETIPVLQGDRLVALQP